MKKGLNITLVGGGSSAHVLIPILTKANHRVSLLTSRPERWSRQVGMEIKDRNNRTVKEDSGFLARISSDPAEVIPGSEVILLCMPVHQYRSALFSIAPYVRNSADVWLGAIYGQAGVNWMIREVMTEFGLNRIGFFAFGLLPWVCRFHEYGHSGINYGPKQVNVAAVFPPDRFAWLNENFLQDVCFSYFGCGAVRQSENFLSLTFSVDNQIIHPGRCYGLYKVHGMEWASVDEVPYFYRDFDELSAQILKALDDEYTLIRKQLIERYPTMNFQYMLDYLGLEQLSYQSCNTDIRESFVNSMTLRQIKPPVVPTAGGRVRIDVNHRFFLDDINYGLCVAKWFADQLALAVPMIDEILLWARNIREESYQLNGKLRIPQEDLTGFKYGIPLVYGLTGLDQAVKDI